jgi:hypothetical protein
MVTEKLPFEFGLFSALTVQSWEQILASGSFQSKVKMNMDGFGNANMDSKILQS